MAIQQKLADDNPAVTDFRSRLASTHNNIGNLQSDTGKPVEALESYGLALAIFRSWPTTTPPSPNSEAGWRTATRTSAGSWCRTEGQPRPSLSARGQRRSRRGSSRRTRRCPTTGTAWRACQTNSATALLRLGRPAEARALCERAVRLEEALVKDDPETADYRVRLGESLLRCGLARRDEGDAAGAAADWRRADALLEGAGALAPDFTFIQACCHSSLSWAAGRPGSGVSAGEADAEAAKALALLRRAAETGFRNLATYRNETALDPLRGRPDFRLMMMDLAMPTEPFAQ